jgi:hypothetical protein
VDRDVNPGFFEYGVFMTDEFKEFYVDGRDHVEVGFYLNDLPNPRYRVTGAGWSGSGFSDVVWKESGGLEGIFEYEFYGKLAEPEQWKDYNFELTVESWGSFNSQHVKEGYLGAGLFDGKRVWLRLYVKPSISRDILDQLYLFKSRDTHSHYIRCHVMNLRTPEKRTVVNKSADVNDSTTRIAFDIIRLYC